MKHKHAELIKAWADGASIQYKNNNEDWNDCAFNNPYWTDSIEYRIKPEPKPVVDVFIAFDGILARDCVINPINVNDWSNKVKLTFDGETGKLKNAEVL